MLVLEKARLTARLAPGMRRAWSASSAGKRNLTRLMQNSVAVFDRLEAETGQAHRLAEGRLAAARLVAGAVVEIRRSMTLAKSFGFEVPHALGAHEADALSLHRARRAWSAPPSFPSDGYVDPYALTMAYAAGARAKGVAHRGGRDGSRQSSATGRRVTGVVDRPRHASAARSWSTAPASGPSGSPRLAGVALAAGVVEHQYFLTEKSLTLPPTLTTLRDPDKNFYLKPDVGSFAIGGWEDGTKGCWRGAPAASTSPASCSRANMDRLELFALPASERLPLLNEIGIQTVINGAIPVSADGEPIMGLAPELDNFYVACGFTAGIAASGGAGEAMANWILDGDPGMDLWQFDVRRFGPPQAQGALARGARHRGLRRLLQDPLPRTRRCMRRAASGRARSTTRLDAAGAVFGSKFGWERPNWFAPAGHRARRPAELRGQAQLVRRGRRGAPGHPRARGAHRPDLVRQVRDVGAGRRRLPPAPRRQRCRPRGRELHLYPALQREGRHRGGRDADAARAGPLLRRHRLGLRRPRHGLDRAAQAGGRAAPRGHLGLGGDQYLRAEGARGAAAAHRRRSVERRPSRISRVREIELGHARVRAARIGYVGELGWELHVPVEYAAGLYDRIVASGRPHGIANAGYRAIDTCRMEKGYLYWSGDITPETNPYEAGLGFCVRLDKGDFIGRDGAGEGQGRGAAAEARHADGRRLRALPWRRDHRP